MLKILFAIDGLGTGGAERSLAESLPLLARDGIRGLVVCLDRREQGVHSDVSRGEFGIRVLPRGSTWSRIRAFRRVIVGERPDLIHTTHFRSSILARLAAVGTSAPVLTSLVSTPYVKIRHHDPHVRAVSLAGVRLIDAWTARHLTTHFHAVSHAVKESAMARLGIEYERITVIHRGRDPKRLGLPWPERRRRVRDALGLGAEQEILISVGRHEFPKGQTYLIEALAEIVRRRPQVVLLMVGRYGHATGQLGDVTRRRALGDRVRLLGHRDDVADLLAASDLFVLPSLYEGLPGALLEALALGLPVVASDLAAVREVVEEGRSAVLVPPAAPSALANAIESLLKDRRRAQVLGDRGREVFHRCFTIDRSAKRMVQLYERLTTGG